MRKAYDLSVWDPAKLGDSISFFNRSYSLDPDIIHMNARDYVDIRKFGRDLLNIESRAEMLEKGGAARFHGVTLRHDMTHPLGVISMSSGDIVMAHVNNPGRWSESLERDHNLYFHLGAYESCLEAGVCLAVHVMGS